jgi:large subunit ribosomal protein LP0
MGGRSANKAGYFDKLKGLLEEYSSIFIVTVDNVSSQQMHEIRLSLRGEGVVLMGKNTMVCLCACKNAPMRLTLARKI